MTPVVRIGVAGFGRMGRIHAENIAYRLPQASLVAICTRQKESVAYAKEKFPQVALYNDFDQMIASPDLDAVVIATASDKHCQQVIKALQAGKHVFTEKPLGTDLESCQATLQASKQHPNLIFMVGFMRRYDASYAYAMEKIRQQAIGTPYLIKATALDPAAAVEEFIKYTTHSAGIFLDLGIHDIDLMRWYLSSEITEVYAAGATFKYPEFHQLGDDEAAVATLRFASGALGQMHIGRTGPDGYHVETEIVGTDGTIRISAVPAKNRAELLTNGGVVTECVEGFPERFAQAYHDEIQAFIQSVLTGTAPIISPEDGVKAVEGALAATKAWKTGKPVQL
jgi:myo-inositol 2-dehydrogenase/D-chiro-inositol 1-dehydrogenase